MRCMFTHKRRGERERDEMHTCTQKKVREAGGGEGRMSRNREKRRKYELDIIFATDAIHLIKQYKSIQSSFSQITEADRITLNF